MPITTKSMVHAVVLGFVQPPRNRLTRKGNTMPPAPITPRWAKFSNEAKRLRCELLRVDTGTSVLFDVLYMGYATA